MEQLTRRSFMGAAAAGLTMASCASVALADEGASQAEPSWDAEADVLIVGAGFAGTCAAITMQKEGLGTSIVFDVAPEDQAGGNSRVCSQILFTPTDVEGAMTYQRNLNGDYVVDEERLRGWAEGVVANLDWLGEIGCTMVETDILNPEFPEIEGGECAKCYLLDGVPGNSVLWSRLHEISLELGCTYEYDCRIVSLVTDPMTKEVLGVQAEDGRCFRANKGVILACGGFENNPEMMRTYYPVGYPNVGIFGTPWNRGDGITIAQSVGAKLWNMNSFAGPYYGPKLVGDAELPEQFAGTNMLSYAPLSFSTTKDFILIGPDGSRYMNEDTLFMARHGKKWSYGTYVQQPAPGPAWAIIGQESYDAGVPVVNLWAGNGWTSTIGLNPYADNAGYLESGVIVKCETAADIAAATGIPEHRITETLDNYNRYVEEGFDPDFHRGSDVYSYGTTAADPGAEPEIPASELTLMTPPYYIFRFEGAILNSQGGPMRQVDGSVVDVFDNVIPRLYAAGELGAAYPYNYNGGGNIADAIASGRMAAQSASALEARA